MVSASKANHEMGPLRKGPHLPSRRPQICVTRRKTDAMPGGRVDFPMRGIAPQLCCSVAAIVPTIDFRCLYVLVVLRNLRRHLVWFGVTAHPTAEWISCQLREAFPWNEAPAHLIRDNDAKFGIVFKRSIHRMGIRDRPIAPRSPWQNGCVERVIGSIRRELLDHVIVWSEAHLRRQLAAYQTYYNATRTHLGIAKDSPDHRPHIP